MTASADTSTIIRSPWLGDIETDPDSELFFPCGLPGFENHRRMVPLEIPSHRPLVYLQSLESPEVCFVALPVYVIDPAFRLRLSEDDRANLQFPVDYDPEVGVDVLCLALLRKSGALVEANLNACVVINLRNRYGVQCLPPGGIPALFRLSADKEWRREADKEWRHEADRESRREC